MNNMQRNLPKAQERHRIKFREISAMQKHYQGQIPNRLVRIQVQNQKDQKGKCIAVMMSCYEQYAEESTKNIRRESALQKHDWD